MKLLTFVLNFRLTSPSLSIIWNISQCVTGYLSTNMKMYKEVWNHTHFYTGIFDRLAKKVLLFYHHVCSSYKMPSHIPLLLICFAFSHFLVLSSSLLFFLSNSTSTCRPLLILSWLEWELTFFPPMGVSGGINQGGLIKVLPPNYSPSSFPSHRAHFVKAIVSPLICLHSSARGRVGII